MTGLWFLYASEKILVLSFKVQRFLLLWIKRSKGKKKSMSSQGKAHLTKLDWVAMLESQRWCHSIIISYIIVWNTLLTVKWWFVLELYLPPIRKLSTCYDFKNVKKNFLTSIIVSYLSIYTGKQIIPQLEMKFKVEMP